MKHLKTFEAIKETTFEEKLDIIASYFENIIGITHEDGFIECDWSAYDYEDMNIIYFSFSFTILVDEFVDDFENKIDKFLSQYDVNYKYTQSQSRMYYEIAIKTDKLGQLYNNILIKKDIDIYNL